MTTERIAIKGMHCASCAMNIDEELEELDGVDEATTSYRKQATKVVFDETRIKLEVIEDTIRHLGYESVTGEATR